MKGKSTMEKSKKLHILTSLAIINTFAAPIWGNTNNELQKEAPVISLESHDINNVQDISKSTVKIRSKHLVKLSKLTNKTAYSTTHSTTTTHID
jgi:hypothetical protein